MTILTILHFVGSPTSHFHQELSELYARGCVDALSDPARYRFVFAHVDPHGSWRFPSSLEHAAIQGARRSNFAEAVAIIANAGIDVALPQMFCERGVSDFRAVFELLGIPYLGNKPLQMALAADKAKAKAIVAAAGVDVPDALLLRRGDVYAGTVPAVVKPNSADNSDGLTLVWKAEDFPEAIASAFQHSDAVLIERYIELGREVRCGVIERRSELSCLPLEEYFVDPDLRPIRNRVNKLKRTRTGALSLVAKARSESWIVDGSDPIVASVHAAALACHRALGFRQYSLFDFRVDPSGRPWFLEAGPYCSFSPNSVIPTMAAACGLSLEGFFASSIAEAIAEANRK